MTRSIFSLSVLAAAALAVGSARAADPGYVGTWASDLAQCKVPQERQEAPLVLSKDGYDQHETHCKFTSVDGADGEWKVKSNCTIEGTAEPYDFTLTVSGDTLTVTDEAGARDLLLCK
ncbi:hypothetical protein [Hyphomicrobium sp.]|uniref:hypothetical protein n=1 Tax=Hyphomicrobium sp. TaxID=82 RepID=UPI0025C0FC84|nr:hypothetical protein [Hyphomicrobium sp.]MCC7253931.1 hypothetical protein [Hyphomicrobium sp.]